MGALAIIWFLSRDKYDWVAYYSNLLLVAVGIGGVAVGVCTVLFVRGQVVEMRRQRLVMQQTLVSINRQAEHMEAQVEVMKSQAEDSRKAVEKTLVLQFRPKVVVRGGMIGSAGSDKGELFLLITNVGGTRASVVEWVMQVESFGESLLIGNETQILQPTVIEPGESRRHSIWISVTAVGMMLEANRTGKTFLCRGIIRYTDDLGIARMTGISRRFNPESLCFERRTDTELDYSD